MQIVNLNQQEIISAFATGTGALAGVWAHNIYTLEERTGAHLMCSGTDVGGTIPGTLVGVGHTRRRTRTRSRLMLRYIAGDRLGEGASRRDDQAYEGVLPKDRRQSAGEISRSRDRH